MKNICLLMLLFWWMAPFAQPPKDSTFFLAKKKGLLGQLGKSISVSPQKPGKIIKPITFNEFRGKRIHNIVIVPLPFNVNINDTTKVTKNFFTKVANGLHIDSKQKTIRNYLFFKEGDEVVPFQIIDNQKYLRNQGFLRDAVIKLVNVTSDIGEKMVDVYVLTRDVFSLGGTASVSSPKKFDGSVKEQNIGGLGNEIELDALYDADRKTPAGFGATYKLNNPKGRFINYTFGVSDHRPTYNFGKRQEKAVFFSAAKPLVSRYTELTGGIDLSLGINKNQYLEDSIFSWDHKYKRLNTDAWIGYNFGSKTGIKTDNYKRLRHFASIRGLYQHFYQVPGKFQNNYNYQYADISGVLLEYSLFKQNYFTTSYIYGFGRNEDVPVGLNASIITGIISKQAIKRAYYGLAFDGSRFSNQGYFSNYLFKMGSYVRNSKFEDVDILLGFERFTKLRDLGSKWHHRAFLNTYFAKQLNHSLNTPLFLNSKYGLPYFNNDFIESDIRGTVRFENAFYLERSYLGFKLSPFLATDASMLRRSLGNNKSLHLFYALGGGLRIRNESLVFGTMEGRAMYIPRPTGGMKNIRFEFGTNIRFKYNSEFITKPDFVNPNY